jgi:hypothetical protein
MAIEEPFKIFLVSNPMISTKVESSLDECIFCLDEPPPPLKKNDKCDCKYSYHPTCQQTYENRLIAEGKQLLCVMCRQQPQTVNEIALIAAHFQQNRRLNIDVPNRYCYYILIGISLILTIFLLLIAYRLFF